MHKRVFTRAYGDPAALPELVAVRLRLDAAAARERIADGAVHVAGARATASTTVAVGDKVTVFMGKATAPPALAVVLRDEWLAVVDKPPGLPCQSERSQDAATLEAQAQRTLGRSTRLMHRLDKEASGLVLLAVTARARAPLQAAFDRGAVDRRYVAVVDGELRGEGRIRLRISRHPTDRRLRVALPEQADAGKPATSRYRVVGHGRTGERAITAVELQLDTGRTHQLRAHLAGIGHPIVGDVAYGGPSFERLCLHAYALELPHPGDGHRVHVTAHLPGAFARLVPGLTTPFT